MTRLKIRTRYIHPSSPRALSVSAGTPNPPTLTLNHGKKRATKSTKVAPATALSPRPQRLTSKLNVGFDSCPKALPEAGDGP